MFNSLQVTEACQRNRCNSKTFRRLEAYRVSTAADIRDCEQTVSNAREIIEQLHKKAKEEAVKYGVGLAVSATATLGKIPTQKKPQDNL